MMYNREIVEELLKKFSVEDTIIFCKIKSYYHGLLQKDWDKKFHLVPFDQGTYEQKWWEDKAEELEHNLKTQEHGTIDLEAS